VNPYSDDKVLYDLTRLEDLKRGRPINPVHVQLIISDLCNHDCGFCAYRMSGYTSNQMFGEMRADGTVNNNPNRMIAESKCYEILDDCWRMGVKAIQFTGGGEPTVHPQHMQVFDYAVKLGLSCALVTNGNRLVEGWDAVLPRFKWVRFSLDAGKAETYAAIRKTKPENYEKALTHMAALREAIEADGSGCVLTAGFVITKDNWQEIRQAAVNARTFGAKALRFSAIFTQEGRAYYEGIETEIIKDLRWAQDESNTADFQVIDMFSQRRDDLTQGPPDYEYCGFQHLTTYIGADLAVYRCCNTAYNERGTLGSLKDRRFREFWESQERHHKMLNFDARGCERCAYNGQNRRIVAAISERVHGEFI
jgi:MoaA/NifB/PqqE/SkfB family radical SAM enzyme